MITNYKVIPQKGSGVRNHTAKLQKKLLKTTIFREEKREGVKKH